MRNNNNHFDNSKRNGGDLKNINSNNILKQKKPSEKNSHTNNLITHPRKNNNEQKDESRKTLKREKNPLAKADNQSLLNSKRKQNPPPKSKDNTHTQKIKKTSSVNNPANILIKTKSTINSTINSNNNNPNINNNINLNSKNSPNTQNRNIPNLYSCSTSDININSNNNNTNLNYMDNSKALTRRIQFQNRNLFSNKDNIQKLADLLLNANKSSPNQNTTNNNSTTLTAAGRAKNNNYVPNFYKSNNYDDDSELNSNNINDSYADMLNNKVNNEYKLKNNVAIKEYLSEDKIKNTYSIENYSNEVMVRNIINYNKRIIEIQKMANYNKKRNSVNSVNNNQIKKNNKLHKVYENQLNVNGINNNNNDIIINERINGEQKKPQRTNCSCDKIKINKKNNNCEYFNIKNLKTKAIEDNNNYNNNNYNNNYGIASDYQPKYYYNNNVNNSCNSQQNSNSNRKQYKTQKNKLNSLDYYYQKNPRTQSPQININRNLFNTNLNQCPQTERKISRNLFYDKSNSQNQKRIKVMISNKDNKKNYKNESNNLMNIKNILASIKQTQNEQLDNKNFVPYNTSNSVNIGFNTIRKGTNIFAQENNNPKINKNNNNISSKNNKNNNNPINNLKIDSKSFDIVNNNDYDIDNDINSNLQSLNPIDLQINYFTIKTNERNHQIYHFGSSQNNNFNNIKLSPSIQKEENNIINNNIQNNKQCQNSDDNNNNYEGQCSLTQDDNKIQEIKIKLRKPLFKTGSSNNIGNNISKNNNNNNLIDSDSFDLCDLLEKKLNRLATETNQEYRINNKSQNYNNYHKNKYNVFNGNESLESCNEYYKKPRCTINKSQSPSNSVNMDLYKSKTNNQIYIKHSINNSTGQPKKKINNNNMNVINSNNQNIINNITNNINNLNNINTSNLLASTNSSNTQADINNAAEFLFTEPRIRTNQININKNNVNIQISLDNHQPSPKVNKNYFYQNNELYRNFNKDEDFNLYQQQKFCMTNNDFYKPKINICNNNNVNDNNNQASLRESTSPKIYVKPSLYLSRKQSMNNSNNNTNTNNIKINERNNSPSTLRTYNESSQTQTSLLIKSPIALSNKNNDFNSLFKSTNLNNYNQMAMKIDKIGLDITNSYNNNYLLTEEHINSNNYYYDLYKAKTKTYVKKNSPISLNNNNKNSPISLNNNNKVNSVTKQKITNNIKSFCQKYYEYFLKRPIIDSKNYYCSKKIKKIMILPKHQKSFITKNHIKIFKKPINNSICFYNKIRYPLPIKIPQVQSICYFNKIFIDKQKNSSLVDIDFDKQIVYSDSKNDSNKKYNSINNNNIINNSINNSSNKKNKMNIFDYSLGGGSNSGSKKKTFKFNQQECNFPEGEINLTFSTDEINTNKNKENTIELVFNELNNIQNSRNNIDNNNDSHNINNDSEIKITFGVDNSNNNIILNPPSLTVGRIVPDMNNSNNLSNKKNINQEINIINDNIPPTDKINDNQIKSSNNINNNEEEINGKMNLSSIIICGNEEENDDIKLSLSMNKDEDEDEPKDIIINNNINNNTNNNIIENKNNLCLKIKKFEDGNINIKINDLNNDSNQKEDDKKTITSENITKFASKLESILDKKKVYTKKNNKIKIPNIISDKNYNKNYQTLNFIEKKEKEKNEDMENKYKTYVPKCETIDKYMQILSNNDCPPVKNFEKKIFKEISIDDKTKNNDNKANNTNDYCSTNNKFHEKKGLNKLLLSPTKEDEKENEDSQSENKEQEEKKAKIKQKKKIKADSKIESNISSTNTNNISSNNDDSQDFYISEIVYLLNILTIDNLNQIVTKISNIIIYNDSKAYNDARQILDHEYILVDILIDKGISEKKFSFLYAILCKELHFILIKNSKFDSVSSLSEGETINSIVDLSLHLRFEDYNKILLSLNNLNQKNKKQNIDFYNELKNDFIGIIYFIFALICVRILKPKFGFECLECLYKNVMNSNLNDKIRLLNLEQITSFLSNFGKIVHDRKNFKDIQSLNNFMNDKYIQIPSSCRRKNIIIPKNIKNQMNKVINKQKNKWKYSLYEQSVMNQYENFLMFYDFSSDSEDDLSLLSENNNNNYNHYKAPEIIYKNIQENYYTDIEINLLNKIKAYLFEYIASPPNFSFQNFFNYISIKKVTLPEIIRYYLEICIDYINGESQINKCNSFINNIIEYYDSILDGNEKEMNKVHKEIIEILLEVDGIVVDNENMFKIMGYLLYILINNEIYDIEDLNSFIGKEKSTLINISIVVKEAIIYCCEDYKDNDDDSKNKILYEFKHIKLFQKNKDIFDLYIKSQII